MENNSKSVGTKPTGFSGIIAGRIMNLIHAGFYKYVINKIILSDTGKSSEITVLDIGCGGGTAVKSFSDHHSVLKVCGIDCSADMVKLSQKTNHRRIENGTVEIQTADVSELPFSDNSFDLITAFDTINFWPDHHQAVKEIYRVLKKSGIFFIINAYPKPGTKWYNFVKFKNNSEYEELLSSGKFVNVSSIFKKQSIIVRGNKH